MFVEGVLMNVQSEAAVEVEEEDAAHVVAFADDDGILCRERAEVGEGGAKHRVRRYVAHAGGFVEGFEISLHATDVAKDAGSGEMGDDLAEDINGVLQGYGVDDEFWMELVDLVGCGEALGIIEEAHAFGIYLIDGAFMVE